MKFEVVLKKTEEGFSASCPMLRGCWSQGKTKKDALDNIRDAIKTYLETVRELNKRDKVYKVEVAA